jgi:hypothetical protein
LDWFKRYAQNLLSSAQRSREDAADKQASILFDQYNQQNEGITAKSVAAVGVRAHMSYLTARVWASIFDNFRGMNADQFFWDFFRLPCNRWDNWLNKLRNRWVVVSPKIGSDPADAGVLSMFNVRSSAEANLENPMLILNAEDHGFPAVTAAEFKQIVAQGQKSMGDGSHAHHFVRASHFSGALDALTRPGLEIVFPDLSKSEKALSADKLLQRYFGPELSLIEAITEADPMRLAPKQALEEKSDLGAATTDKIRSAFDDTYVFEPAVNCPPGRCYVGKLKSKRKGFIELINGQSGLSRLRVAARYGQPGDDGAFAGDQYDKRSKEIFPFLYMIGVLGDAAIDAGWITPEQSVKDVSETVASIRKQMADCKLPFLTFTLGKMVVWVEAKEDNWIFLSAQPFSE